MSHEWGNYPENFTPKMYWGARAILARVSGQSGKSLDLPPDRQSFEHLDGGRMDEGTFFNWINEKVLPELRRHARENRFYEWGDLVTIQSEDGTFMCQATPKNSGGEYLYIGCWEMEQYGATVDGDADSHMTLSSINGDYSPANPWDAPGMGVSDFI